MLNLRIGLSAALIIALGGMSAFYASRSMAASRLTGTTAVKFRMQKDRTIVEVRQDFPLNTSLDEAKATWADVSLIPEISDIISDARSYASGGGYRVETTATKAVAGMTVSATTVNQCSETTTGKVWSRSCRMVTDRSGKDTAKYMHEGSNETRCEEIQASPSSSKLSCFHKITVRPKPINYWPVYKRNPQELGAAGAQASVHDLVITMLIATSRLNPGVAKTAWAGSKIESLAQRLFDDAKAVAVSEELGVRTLIIQFSDANGSYQKEIQ